MHTTEFQHHKNPNVIFKNQVLNYYLTMWENAHSVTLSEQKRIQNCVYDLILIVWEMYVLDA